MADVLVQVLRWLLITLSVGGGVVLMSIAHPSETPTPICSCGATERHATNANMCACGHFIHGNQAAYRHGGRAFERHGDAALPSDVRITADDMLAGIIADKGGTENLTTLKREYAQQARNFRVMLDLIGSHLVRIGLTTERGRVRGAVSKYLEVFDRFDRCAQRLGLEREPRETMSLTARLAAVPSVRSDTKANDFQSRSKSSFVSPGDFDGEDASDTQQQTSLEGGSHDA